LVCKLTKISKFKNTLNLIFEDTCFVNKCFKNDHEVAILLKVQLGQSSGIDNGKNGVEWSIISSEAPKKYF
jgi:hypothetical protein